MDLYVTPRKKKTWMKVLPFVLIPLALYLAVITLALVGSLLLFLALWGLFYVLLRGLLVRIQRARWYGPTVTKVAALSSFVLALLLWIKS